MIVDRYKRKFKNNAEALQPPVGAPLVSNCQAENKQPYNNLVTGCRVMPECQQCGAHVTSRFRRVFGNNDGEVYGCRECMKSTDLLNGEGTHDQI